MSILPIKASDKMLQNIAGERYGYRVTKPRPFKEAVYPITMQFYGDLNNADFSAATRVHPTLARNIRAQLDHAYELLVTRPPTHCNLSKTASYIAAIDSEDMVTGLAITVPDDINPSVPLVYTVLKSPHLLTLTEVDQSPTHHVDMAIAAQLMSDNSTVGLPLITSNLRSIFSNFGVLIPETVRVGCLQITTDFVYGIPGLENAKAGIN